MVKSSRFNCGRFGHCQRSCPLNLAEGSGPREGGSPQKHPTQARMYALILIDEDREKFADMKIDT
jgi:hypothetical protein